MGEYNEQTKRPNLYEHIAPEIRFAYIANAILERSGVEAENSGQVKSVSWPKNPDTYHYVLKVKTVINAQQISTNIYSLEHYIHSINNRIATRYAVAINAVKTSEITIYDSNNRSKKLDPTARREHISELLSILGNYAPEESRLVLNSVFDHHFQTAIGRYVLSDLAVKDAPEQVVSEFAAWVATEDFTESVESIEKAVLVESKANNDPVKHSFIEDAVETRHRPTSKDRFLPVDIEKEATRVAKEIGARWNYIVTPEQ